ncbi:hypothetical protein [Paenibacillus riograndensis]|uniref:hypothetical protein n=1 Tax=Paenibacillus riograndensis TaxID=483937 RepID=UPI0003066AC6|nr:hypothetical protein [Paenibacillus riograndensis]
METWGVQSSSSSGNKKQTIKAEGTISLFPRNSEAERTPYNLDVITGMRGDLPFTEVWLFINAYYDHDAKRYKRFNLDNFSFGLQMQGGGTYPGEEHFGDFINQGVNIWKANGRNAYGKDDPERDKVTEEIGDMVNGVWTEFGIFKGWTNAFMVDAYGGMTIGGAGFEIDGNGVFPYKRLSLGKFQGGNDIPSTDPTTYVYAYNGTLWNAYHGLFDSDQKARNSYYWGMKSNIDYYDNGSFNPGSGTASMEDGATKWVLMKRPKNQPHTVQKWQELFSVDSDGHAWSGVRRIPDITVVKADIVNTTDFNMNYPDTTWTKDNTFIVAVRGVLPDGNTKQMGAINATFTPFGIFGYLGGEFASAEILISKYK